MEDLFRSYWWLIFPLGWMLASAFTSFLNFRRQQRTLDLIKIYAEKGQEPPAELLKVLEKPIDADTEFFGSATADGKPAQARNYWSLFGLFAVLAGGFAWAAWFGNFGDASWPFSIVALTMGAVAVWALVNALFLGKRS